jgi:uncharacterized membrane protein YwaF
MNAWLNLAIILFFVSCDLGTTLALKSPFLFHCPNASALTEFLGPFFYLL